MLFHNKCLLNRVSLITLISICFCIISSPILATDWDKIRREGDEVIDKFYNESEEDSYVEQLKNIFYPKLSEKNKKEPIPIEKMMREAKAQIEASGEKATEKKVQEKLIELILIKVFTPLTQKLDRIMLDNKINYKDISKNVKYPEGSSELLRVLGYGFGATIVSTAILSVLVAIKISCVSWSTYIIAAISAWWAGTSIASATVGATASSVILGPWGIATLLIVGGTTTYFYVRSKMKEAEENKAKAFEELKSEIRKSESKIRYQWLNSIYGLKEKDSLKDKDNLYDLSDDQDFTYSTEGNKSSGKYILFKIKAKFLNSTSKIRIYKQGIIVHYFDFNEFKSSGNGYEIKWDLKDRVGNRVKNGTYEAKIEENNQIKDVLKFVVLR